MSTDTGCASVIIAFDQMVKIFSQLEAREKETAVFILVGVKLW